LLGKRPQHLTGPGEIDKFDTPLPATAERRIEAPLNENGIGFADNTPRVTLYRGAAAESRVLQV
jgi:hypothetical protein